MMQNCPCGGISVLLEEASSVRLSLSRPTTVITIFKDPLQPLFKMIQCFFFPSSNKTENFICFCLQDTSVKSVRLHILTGIPNTVATLLMCNTKKLFSVGRVLNHQISSKAQEEGRNRRKGKKRGAVCHCVHSAAGPLSEHPCCSNIPLYYWISVLAAIAGGCTAAYRDFP